MEESTAIADGSCYVVLLPLRAAKLVVAWGRGQCQWPDTVLHWLPGDDSKDLSARTLPCVKLCCKQDPL